MQVFEVAPAPRVVVVARAEDGAVEAQHGRELRARRLNLHQPEQQPRELRQLLLVNRRAGKRCSFLKSASFVFAARYSLRSTPRCSSIWLTVASPMWSSSFSVRNHESV